MFKIQFLSFLYFCSFLILSTCASTSPSSNSGTSSTSARTALNENRPTWVDSVDSVYNRARYVAAVGHATDRTMAERNAFASLVAIFGQSIYADQVITNTYQEAIRSGVVTGWTDDIAMQNTIRTSTSMDTLVGAEIREVWFDSRGTYFAAAVMEKVKAAQLYTEMIKANQNMIINLTTMNPTEKNSLEGFSRYQFAAAVADINISYGNLLRQIDTTPPAGLVSGDTYRLEARNITREIPVGITVRNDREGRIQGAFAKAFSDLGFRTGGTGSRYMLNVNVNVSPVDNPQAQNQFVRIELDARFNDNNATILPYNFNSREGHLTLSEAENRAYRFAEQKINQEYANNLRDYLTRLIPEKR